MIVLRRRDLPLTNYEDYIELGQTSPTQMLSGQVSLANFLPIEENIIQKHLLTLLTLTYH